MKCPVQLIVWLLGLFVIIPGYAQEPDVAAQESEGGLLQMQESDPLPPPEVRGILADATEMMQNLDFAGTDTLLRRAVVRYPDSMQVWYMLASVQIKLNKYDEAVRLLEALLKKKPDDYRLLNNLSWLLSTASDEKFRNPERALELARNAILLAPGDYHIWSTLAEAHYANGNFSQAIKVIQQGLDLAARRNAPAPALHSYRLQLRKIQEAHQMMSLLE